MDSLTGDPDDLELTTLDAITTEWNRLVTWLHENAPRTADDISPARAADHAADVGSHVADPVIQRWLTLHDGQVGNTSGLVKDGWRPLSGREIRDWHTILVDSNRKYDGDRVDEVEAGAVAGEVYGVFLRHHVPVLGHDDGTFMFVDLGSGDRRGCVREWAREDGDQPEAWSGLAEMLSITHRDAIAGMDCTVADGGLTWDW